VQISMRLSFPRDARSVPLLRAIVKDLLGNVGAPAEASSDIQIALSEACSNAVRHAHGSSEYTVSMAMDRSGCEVEVVDNGRWLADTPDTPEHVEPEAESGRGLYLMEALVDDFEFIREADETTVRLIKRWPGLGVLTDERGQRTRA
jgi:serine/threonine-protein kinase RsbW